jgi:carboxymethylenebutenolidase
MKMTKKNPYDQKLLDLYDGYAHGLISRREFLDRAVIFTTGGLTAAGLLRVERDQGMHSY